jgi:hypothetical protein
MTIDPRIEKKNVDAQKNLVVNLGDRKFSVTKLGNWKILVIDCGDRKLVTKCLGNGQKHFSHFKKIVNHPMDQGLISTILKLNF